MDSHFDKYKHQFGVREANLATKKFDDEVEDLRQSQEVEHFTPAPQAAATLGAPALAERSQGEQKHLWVVATDGYPLALEAGALGRTRRRGYLAHTNLTGGRPAYCGGELWFKDERSFWLTGGSGRYKPRSAAELEAVVDAFRSAGYEVASCGWDQYGPARFFRGEPQWK